MRIRTIKPEFFMHTGLYLAEKESGLPLRLAFVGLWCAADREGRLRDDPMRLKAEIFPYDEIDFSRVTHALTTRGFLVKYSVGEGQFLSIPSFTRHQIINPRERASELPNPPQNQGLDEPVTRESRVAHASTTRVHREGKGREQGGEAPLNGAQTIVYDRELRRLEKAMDTIKKSYDEHMSWDTKDQARFSELKARRFKIRQLLGLDSEAVK